MGKEIIVKCSELGKNFTKPYFIKMRRGFYAYPKGKSVYVLINGFWELFVVMTYFTEHYDEKKRNQIKNWASTLEKNKDRFVIKFKENIGIKNFIKSCSGTVSIIREKLIPLEFYDFILDK